MTPSSIYFIRISFVETTYGHWSTTFEIPRDSLCTRVYAATIPRDVADAWIVTRGAGLHHGLCTGESDGEHIW